MGGTNSPRLWDDWSDQLTTSDADIIQQSGEIFEKYGVGLIRFIDIAEVLGALGLILPAGLRILPILTPLAALGLAIIMCLATALHASKGEPIVTQVVFLLLTLFVVWGIFSKARISTPYLNPFLLPAAFRFQVVL